MSSNEIESLKRDLNNTNDELAGVQHHRTVLRETIEKLEKHCQDQNDEIVDLRSKTSSSDVRDAEDDDEMLRKQPISLRSECIHVQRDEKHPKQAI